MAERILVVEDETDQSDLVRFLLLDWGYEVDLAVNGLVALECVRLHRPDLILLDLVMPEMDGLGFLDFLSMECPPPLPPVIACSSADKIEMIALARGAVSFIQKPLRPDDLRALIRSVLTHEAIVSRS